MELKLVCTLLCCVLVSALYLPERASGGSSLGRKLLPEIGFGKKAEVAHATAKGLKVEVSSGGTKHKYEDEGGLIFYDADYSLATTHAPPLPKHHP
ncbi:hypothetical protein ZIOFF_004267 [Zingiber officinale]|uniref:Uncharacterized protein n=1 Tax=Zingiber officinale TaxID=94328 RepID=A0A8J5LU35_ZINOF|nr:hypothetical protein ZIOFF_004267 [Zingiber officinale]